MNKKAGRPRIEEVARRAGVSSATVSRFFSRRDLVSDKTAERIKKVADELGYRPNRLAGSLVTRRSRLVALLVPALTESPFNAMIEAIVDALGERGYTAMLGLTGNKYENMDKVIETALGLRVDGIIVTGVINDPATRTALRSEDVTVVETWGLPLAPIDCAVGFSHHEMGRMTAEFIQRRGYQFPLIVTARGSRAAERRDGFVSEWAKLTAADYEEIQVDIPYGFGQARSVFRQMRSLATQPDVVICGSDALALGIIVEAGRAGLSVPDDLAVIGLGNRSIAGDMRPSITTIAIDGHRIGQEAAKLFHDRAEGKDDGQRIIDVGFQLIERESA